MSIRGAELPQVSGKIHELLSGMPFISAFALTGSRARGDNFVESDFDVLVVDTRNPSSPFLKRTNLDGESIDLIHVPLAWLTKQIPYELDQMLFESKVLADRDGMFASAQKLIRACNYEFARVAGRMCEIILRTDVLLSRASSALSRLDFDSCILHSKMAVIEVSKILLEMRMMPYRPSRLAMSLRSAAGDMDISSAMPSSDQAGDAKGSLREIMRATAELSRLNPLPSSEPLERMWAIAYYSDEDFARRTMMLLEVLLANDHLEDSMLYAQVNAYKILEACQQLLKPGTMTDYVTILRQMRTHSNPQGLRLYRAMAALHNIHDPTGSDASEMLRRAREYTAVLKQARTYATTRNNF